MEEEHKYMENGSGRDLKRSTSLAYSRIGSTYKLTDRCLPDRHFKTSKSRDPTDNIPLLC